MFLFCNHSALVAAHAAKELAGIENHHGGKQSSPKTKEIHFCPFKR
jgi:hypothetical protein